MKKVCVLLPWSVSSDSRAQRTIRTMSRHAHVHLYFVPKNPGDAGVDFHPGRNVRLIPVPHTATRLDLVLRNSFFYLETTYLSDAVEATGETYDIVYAHDLHSAYPAQRIARKQGAKVLYDVHDLTIETINQGFPETAPFPKRLKYALAKWVMRTAGARWESTFIRQADLVIAPTEPCLGHLRHCYGFAGGLAVPNFPEYREVQHTERLHDDAGLPRTTRIALYHGTLGRGRYLHEIVRSAEHFAEGNALVLVGNGHLLPELKAIAGPKVRFIDAVPYDQLLPLASAASLGLVLIDHINLSKKYALANKLTEYMAAGLAVLGSDSPENRRVLTDADAGYLYQVTTPEALGAYINGLLARPQELEEKGSSGQRAFRDRYHWEASEPLFEQAFLKLLGAS